MVKKHWSRLTEEKHQWRTRRLTDQWWFRMAVVLAFLLTFLASFMTGLYFGGH